MLASKAGYAPSGLPNFLKRLQERNNASTEKRGLFASHPQMDERLEKLAKQIETLGGTATLESRFTHVITYRPVAQSAIATVTAGSVGLAGGSNGSKSEKPASAEQPQKTEEAPKKRGFGLGGFSRRTSAAVRRGRRR
jgi:predicted Zn-dependent protease